MVIARKPQLYLIIFALCSAFLVLCTFLLLTGALGAGLREVRNEFVLASVYMFC